MLQPIYQLPSSPTHRPATLDSYSQAVERVIYTMRAQLSEPLCLEEMAEIACLSPYHFNRVFRTITGIPPGEFLAALRLDAAKRLLLTTSLSATDVCFELGYISFGTFTTRFKQRIGVSPLHLRQLASVLARDALPPLDMVSRKAKRLVALPAHGVSGTITTPRSFAGTIFIGMFPRPIPQSRPVACATITAPGHFQIPLAPDGRYYVFAAGVPEARSALSYLLPETGMLVGVAAQPVVVCDGQASAPAEVALRPRLPSDPPILGIFPPLLALPGVVRSLTPFHMVVPTAQDKRSAS